jgi:pyrimidine deaminase RibD-like protein
MTHAREMEIMRLAIAEAKKSKAEDGRPHPKVGAVLVDETGAVLYQSFRGEEKAGGHAEFHILAKATKDKRDLKGAVLFVTLEPCTRRGESKIPCAIRVAESGIRRIVIGTLDPNPSITGHGEMYLSYQMEVDRFPGALARELQELNKTFFDEHKNKQVPAVSIYAGGNEQQAQTKWRPSVAGQREGILQQSMDLISGTSEDVCIFAGDLSWLRELQLAIVLAKVEKRSIKIICDKADCRDQEFGNLVTIARRLGADVGLLNQDIPIRGTLVSPDSDEAAMMCVERKPSKHAILFQAPHEAGIIKAMKFWADDLWSRARIQNAFEPEIERLNPEKIASALQAEIPQYSVAQVKPFTIDPNCLKPLATCLERFKLFRLNQVAIFQEKFKTNFAAIKGSPWPIFPPVIEQLADETCVIIDGTHRVFSAIQRGSDRMDVILVSGASPDLPAKPLDSWDDVKIHTQKMPREQRYREFNPNAFRSIRSVVSKLVQQ